MALAKGHTCSEVLLTPMLHFVISPSCCWFNVEIHIRECKGRIQVVQSSSLLCMTTKEVEKKHKLSSIWNFRASMSWALPNFFHHTIPPNPSFLTPHSVQCPLYSQQSPSVHIHMHVNTHTHSVPAKNTTLLTLEF